MKQLPYYDVPIRITYKIISRLLLLITIDGILFVNHKIPIKMKLILIETHAAVLHQYTSLCRPAAPSCWCVTEPFSLNLATILSMDFLVGAFIFVIKVLNFRCVTTIDWQLVNNSIILTRSSMLRRDDILDTKHIYSFDSRS